MKLKLFKKCMRNVIIQAVQEMLRTVYQMDRGASKVRYRSDKWRSCRVARVLCLVTKYLNHIEHYAFLRSTVTVHFNFVEYYQLFETHCDRPP